MLPPATYHNTRQDLLYTKAHTNLVQAIWIISALLLFCFSSITTSTAFANNGWQKASTVSDETNVLYPNDQKSTTDLQSKKTSPDTEADKVKVFIRNTEAPEWKTRWDAVNALGELKDPRGIPALTKRALYDVNPHPRWRSLWALSSIDRSGDRIVPTFLNALKQEDPIVVHNAAVALAFFGRQDARPQLYRDLYQPDEFRRWETIFSFHKIGNANDTETLIQLLSEKNEPSKRVRGEAALVLGKIGNDEVMHELLYVLLRDSSHQVRSRAALALSRFNNPCLIDELQKTLSSETNSIALESIKKAIEKISRSRSSSSYASPDQL